MIEEILNKYVVTVIIWHFTKPKGIALSMAVFFLFCGVRNNTSNEK